ncbi:MAG: hypothetical protein FIB06_07050 [Betaproteobacteria bacterium]|nr:hypothetical protein [Betaproteobacteria bacterium]
MKSSRIGFAALFALATVSSFAAESNSRQAQPTVKVVNYAPATNSAKPLKKASLSPLDSNVAAILVLPPSAAGPASSSTGLEPRVPDINEQFTRASCCP